MKLAVSWKEGKRVAQVKINARMRDSFVLIKKLSTGWEKAVVEERARGIVYAERKEADQEREKIDRTNKWTNKCFCYICLEGLR